MLPIVHGIIDSVAFWLKKSSSLVMFGATSAILDRLAPWLSGLAIAYSRGGNTFVCPEIPACPPPAAVAACPSLICPPPAACPDCTCGSLSCASAEPTAGTAPPIRCPHCRPCPECPALLAESGGPPRWGVLVLLLVAFVLGFLGGALRRRPESWEQQPDFNAYAPGCVSGESCTPSTPSVAASKPVGGTPASLGLVRRPPGNAKTA